ncbi:MAG: metallophosphoesterase [Ruminococcus sp.]|nr:metallophosphoesterase [Ruminococcus sp.]
MKILVVSDTHGDFNSLLRAVKAQPDAEVIVHCGDGDEQVQLLKDAYKDKMIVGVRGNNDWNSFLPSTETLSILGKKIFITHGHLYDAKIGLYKIMCAAREAEADILLYGHTHIAMTSYEDGLHLMNPGSCHGYMASYGILEITEKGDILTNIVKVK